MPLAEIDVVCPYCGESFATAVEPSDDEQSYIEDCYVCCQPIQFTVVCVQGEVKSVQTTRSQ